MPQYKGPEVELTNKLWKQKTVEQNCVCSWLRGRRWEGRGVPVTWEYQHPTLVPLGPFPIRPVVFCLSCLTKAKTEVSALHSLSSLAPPWLPNFPPGLATTGNSDSGVWPWVLQPCPGGWAHASLSLTCGLQSSVHQRGQGLSLPTADVSQTEPWSRLSTTLSKDGPGWPHSGVDTEASGAGMLVTQQNCCPKERLFLS